MQPTNFNSLINLLAGFQGDGKLEEREVSKELKTRTLSFQESANPPKRRKIEDESSDSSELQQKNALLGKAIQLMEEGIPNSIYYGGRGSSDQMKKLSAMRELAMTKFDELFAKKQGFSVGVEYAEQLSKSYNIGIQQTGIQLFKTLFHHKQGFREGSLIAKKLITAPERNSQMDQRSLGKDLFKALFQHFQGFMEAEQVIDELESDFGTAEYIKDAKEIRRNLLASKIRLER